MLIDPLNISSTPVAILSNIGLKTSVGVSSDDPKNERNLKLEMHVILSIYGNSKLISRKIIDTLKPKSHKFYSIDEELEKLNISDQADFCVLHRVPTNLMLSNEIPGIVEVKEYASIMTKLKERVKSLVIRVVAKNPRPLIKKLKMAELNPKGMWIRAIIKTS